MSRLVKPFPCSIPPAPGEGFLWLGSVLIVWALGACSSIPQDQRDPDDALEIINRPVYDFNEGLDRVALKPVTNAYTLHVPQGVRTGVSHFFDNIQYLNTVLNGFLQGKVRQGLSDLARFGINSTIGVLGVFDVATPLGLEQHREDFGQTLAVWQVGDGAYVVYPVLGPSSVRDTGGIVVSLLTNPILYAVPPIAIPLGILETVDLRARNEGFVRFRDVAAGNLDPYAFTRASYLQHRQSEIYDGNPPRPKFELFDDTVAEPHVGEAAPEPTPRHQE
ncbi:MAG: VacJ family lipoprotein [Thiobacillus sp.]|nr:VacJ family lipoprotein [Thiobacillus sp.]MDP1925234.1 VacJ family lipoprotein [Thiobacillus sp.]